MVKLALLEAFFHLSAEYVDVFLTKLITITHYQVYMTLMTLSRSRVQRSRSHTLFPKNPLFNTDRHFAIEDRQRWVWLSDRPM